MEKPRVYIGLIVRGGGGGLGVHLDAFFILFFTIEGEGGNGYIFSPRYMGLGWKEDGEMGTFRVPLEDIYLLCLDG